MTTNRKLILSILVCCSIVLTGCWNYREIEQLAIVAGAALDKNEDGTVHLTIEVVNVAGDGEVVYKPVYIQSDGKTFFEAVRNAIAREGQKLYWSHAKALIISQEVAKEDVVRYLDFLYRDAEAREDTWLLVSAEKTAGEIFKIKGMLNPIISFQIDDTMRSQKSTSRFPYIELFEYTDRLAYKQVSPVLPLIHTIKQDGEQVSMIGGTAVFKRDKMTATLDENHTKCLLWLRNELEGGLKIIEDAAGTKDDVTLEIYSSKSKITPILQGGNLKMKVDIEMDVSISEISGTTDFISKEGREKLRKSAEGQIEKDIETMYKMVRDQHHTDIFGFGRRIEMQEPAVWRQIKDNWDEYFAELDLAVNVDLYIRGSATTRTPIIVGE